MVFLRMDKGYSLQDVSFHQYSHEFRVVPGIDFFADVFQRFFDGGDADSFLISDLLLA